VYKKQMSVELASLTDTIKILNDDDALALMKKTLPAASSASFLQLASTKKDVRSTAIRVLKKAGHKGHRLNSILLALQGKKKGFDVVIEKCSGLMTLLQKEQAEDDDKKVFCEKELDKTEDEKKTTERGIADVKTVIGEAEDTLEAISKEIEGGLAGIKVLDGEVDEQTNMRKTEHKAVQEELAEANAAKSLLEMAKSRLGKFYSKTEEKPEPEAAIQTDDDEAESFVQLKMTSRSRMHAKEAPVMADLKHKKKSEAASGVVEMLNVLKEDLTKNVAELETQEENDQKDYEESMAESASKRALNARAVADKEAQKADLEAKVHKVKEKLRASNTDLMETMEELMGLHKDCDFLLKNFDIRKKAREDEGEAISKAKAVLAGADYK